MDTKKVQLQDAATGATKQKLNSPTVPYNQRLLLRTPAAAQMLSIGERKLSSMKASGVIPHVKIDGCTAYRLEDLKRFIDETAKNKTR